MKRFLVLLILFTIHDNFAQSPSQWKEDNPFELGLLSYMQFVNDSVGWVMPIYATANNAIFKTTNGGDSWFCASELNSGGHVWQKPFVFTDTDTGYYCTRPPDSGQYWKILKTIDGGINWSESYTFPYYCFIQNSFFLNGSTGWIIHESSSPTQAYNLLKTTNGGNTWSVIHSYPNFGNYAVYLTFFDENVGLRFHSNNTSFLEKTINGGVNWHTIFTWNSDVRGMKFINENTGYVPVNGVLKKTTNGGITWTNLFQPSGGYVDRVETKGESVIVAYGSASSLNTIYVSTNNGLSWTTTSEIRDGLRIPDIVIINPDKIFLTMFAYILKATNLGSIWSKVPIGPTHNLESIISVQGGKPFAVGWKQDSVSNQIESAVVSSPPLWRTKSTHTSQKFNCLSAKTNSEIFIGGADFSSGNNSLIIKCNNEGDNLDIKYNSSGPPVNSISFADTNLGFAVGDQGVILKTLNGGNTWTQEPSNTVNDLNIISFKSPLGFIGGSNGFLIRTINDGMDWSQVNLGTNIEINSVCIQDQNRIWIAGDEGLFMFSSDGGLTWSSFSNYSIYNFYSIIAIDQSNIGVFGGKISDNSLFFIESHNGGLSWQERLIPHLKKINIAFAKSNEAWAVGDYGTIIFTDRWFLPVELTSFIATLNRTKVNINWQTATELNNQGFEIQRKFDNSDWFTIGFRTGKGTTTEPTSYFYEDDISELNSDKLYYRLKQIDFNGTFSYSAEVEVITQPLDFALYQNYPNPFNPTTTIKYEIPQSSNVKIEVFDILGRVVKVLFNEQKDAGRYEIKFDASSLASGIYYYRIKANDFIQTKKMMLIK